MNRRAAWAATKTVGLSVFAMIALTASWLIIPNVMVVVTLVSFVVGAWVFAYSACL